LTSGAIDTLMAPVRGIHAEDEDSVRADEQLAHGSGGDAHV